MHNEIANSVVKPVCQSFACNNPSTNIAIIANNKGIAAAAFSPEGKSNVRFHRISGLPVWAILPNEIFGSQIELAPKGSDILKDVTVNKWDDIPSALFQQIFAACLPTPPEIQQENVRALSKNAANYARERFDAPNIAGDVGYLVDDRSECGCHGPWEIGQRTSLTTLKDNYSAICKPALAEAFSKISLSETEWGWLEDYIYKEVRDGLSSSATDIMLFGMMGKERVPALDHFAVDQFVADALKVIRAPMSPYLIDEPRTSCALTFTSRFRVGAPPLENGNGNNRYCAGDFESAVELLAAHFDGIDRAAVGAAFATASRRISDGLSCNDEWDNAFGRASPSQLKMFATAVSQAMSGPDAVLTDAKGCTEVVLIER
jgi:hypothetical protein